MPSKSARRPHVSGTVFMVLSCLSCFSLFARSVYSLSGFVLILVGYCTALPILITVFNSFLVSFIAVHPNSCCSSLVILSKVQQLSILCHWPFN